MNEHILPAKQNIGAASVRAHYLSWKGRSIYTIELPVPFEIVIGKMIL